MWQNTTGRDSLLQDLSEITAVDKTGKVPCPAISIVLEPTSEGQKGSVINNAKAFLRW